MADKTKDFVKRRKELAGVSALKGLDDTNSYLARRTRLAGLTSVNFSSALKDMPKPKPSKISDVAKKIFKKSPVGKVIDTGTKIGLGVAAGYEYAKSKFKKDDKSEDVKVDKKATGGMAEYIKDLL